ncbi:hypothetical protein [Actinosynnema mirum]|uniref:Uncharacterized protein n=1 Tax=Actinosynnema mirum (strain ATCC 29888 / DSM 43827 / JCM 3225 / NBRC 14064 / NCIMB 13271 / NRRL B-12336 / IMRU 3971 / 101) TaxID=446462 RepID=C6W940_ACTMD|nr:hypothetical protein [Actinosynnema mirum]ACU39112.1 hypothetical protein Amir_5291 [Actinosynnema mirum DSM 43827]
MSTTPVVPAASYESMTVRVRAGLGEDRLAAAVEALTARHSELSDGGTSSRRVVVGGDPARARGGEALSVVWVDAGAEPGRLVLSVRQDVLAALPWRVLLPELASEWKTH